MIVRLLVWVAGRLRPYLPKPLGVQRLLRDGLSISGRLYFDHHGQLAILVLNALHPLALPFFRAFEHEWASLGLHLLLREI